MKDRILLGMLTPSSNTILEPVTAAMIAGLPEVSAHFSRFPVTEIALSERALKQFDHTEILRAAELLSHAEVDVIAWNGTSSGWLGFDTDERLCGLLSHATGIPACTSVLALNEELEAQTGIPIYDTVATAVWKCLEVAGVDVRRVKGWGRLFRELR